MISYINNQSNKWSNSVHRSSTPIRHNPRERYVLHQQKERGMEASLWNGHLPCTPRFTFKISCELSEEPYRTSDHLPSCRHSSISSHTSKRSLLSRSTKRKKVTTSKKNTMSSQRRRRTRLSREQSKRRICSSKEDTGNHRSRCSKAQPSPHTRTKHLTSKTKRRCCLNTSPPVHPRPCPKPKPIPTPKPPQPCPPTPIPPDELIVCAHTVFDEQKFLNLDIQGERNLPPQDTSVASVISYAVHNQGSAPLSAVLEISPNAIDYVKDTTMTIDGESIKVIVPLRFLRWMRLKLITVDEEPGIADVYFQCQSLACTEEELC